MTADFSFASTDLLAALGGCILFVVLAVFAVRRYYAHLSKSGLTEKYKDKKWSSPLEARNKYPDMDVFRLSNTFFRVGLAISLAIIIGAFNWTNIEEKFELPDYALDMGVDLEVEPPRTQEAPPPPPPPPPPVIEEIPEGVEIEDMEELDFVDQSVEAETAIDVPPPVVKKDAAPPPPPPPPPPPEPEVEEIFRVVEEMPRFPGCEDMVASTDEKKACADKKMLEFIYSHIRYPAIARDNGIEGTVVVQFVVDRDGRISEAQVLRDVGGGCGAEAMRIVQLMNEMPQKWAPGKQRGIPVRVMFTLPVRFKLEHTN
jgi:protein TonB